MKLRIEKAVYGGQGLAHQTEGADAGRAVFVPFTLPGEFVEVQLIGEKDGFGEAELVQVLDASPDRVAPTCGHFKECGGCQYQHVRYEAQITVKAEILEETLRRAGIEAFPEVVAHSAGPWKYRNRIRVRLMTVEGVLHIGYNRRSSNEFFPISECPVAAPLLWRAAEALLQLGTKSLDTARWIRDAKEVEFFCTGDENALQLTVFTQNGNTGGFADFCARMKALVPELVGAGISLLPDHSRRQTQLPGPLSEWRADGLIYAAAGEEYWVSRGSFFQVNRFLVDELATLVTRGRKGTTAWDLYAGVGLFSRLLSHSFPQLVAVEASGEDLVKSFKGPGRHAIAATTVEFLRGAIVQRERPQLVVIDPPRAGIGAEVCALLSRIAAKELVYVSCDPVTLARDLKMLIQSGYTIAELHMVDMFPQTFHLETVVVLHKFI